MELRARAVERKIEYKPQEREEAMLRSTTILILSYVFIQGGPSFAQEQTDDTFYSEQVEVDGQWNDVPKPQKPTPADHTRKAAEELKRKTNEWVDNTVEKERLQAEKGIANKIKNMFQGKRPQKQAKKQEAVPVPKVEERNPRGTSISFTGGISHLMISDDQGLSTSDYTPKGSFAFELSKRVSPQVDLGLGVSYNSFKFSKNPYPFNRNNYNYYGTGLGYYQDRAISGRILSLHLMGKFYLTEGEVQPFISGLFGYNGLMLEYDRQIENTYNFYPSYGREKSYTDSYINTGLGTGVIIYFSENFGGIIEGNFTKNFAVDFKNDKESSDYRQHPSSGYNYIDDRSVLTNLGEEIKDGIQLDITLGIIASF